MRALFLIPRPGIRGPIPRIAAILIDALHPLGCDIAIEYWGRRSDHESPAERLAGRAGDILRIRRALAQRPPDVMVVTTAHDLPAMARDLPLLLATRRRSPRIVVHLHGSQSGQLVAAGHRLVKAASGQLLRLADATLVLSTEEQREWRQFSPTADIRVVRNPYILADDAPPAFDKAALGLPHDAPLLFFAGRLVAAKGIFDLLEALPHVLQRTRCHLLVAGSGEEAEQVRAAVAWLGLDSHVTLAGYLEGERLRSAYRLADVFVLPSYHAEGFPTVIAEAMDAGLPIVTTCLRGTADYLVEGEHALFVPPRDPAALAEVILRLLADAPLRARMAAANRLGVRAFAPDVVAREYLQILEEVVGRP